MLVFLMYISVLMSVEVLLKSSFGAFLFPVCKSHHAEELLFMNERNSAASAICLDHAGRFNGFSGRRNRFICPKKSDYGTKYIVFQRRDVGT